MCHTALSRDIFALFLLWGVKKYIINFTKAKIVLFNLNCRFYFRIKSRIPAWFIMLLIKLKYQARPIISCWILPLLFFQFRVFKILLADYLLKSHRFVYSVYIIENRITYIISNRLYEILFHNKYYVPTLLTLWLYLAVSRGSACANFDFL